LQAGSPPRNLTAVPDDNKSSSLSPSDLLVHAGSRVFILRIVAVALALGVELLLTRTLGQEQYGVLSIGLSWLLILSIVGSFGMDTALVRFIPDDLAHERYSLAAGRISYALRAMVSGGVMVGAIFAAGVWVFSPESSPTLAPTLLVIAMLVPVQTANLHRAGVLQGLKLPVLGLMPDQVVRVAILGVLLLALRYLIGDLNSTSGALAVGVSLLGALTVGQVFIRRNTPGQLRGSKPARDNAIFWSTALPLGWMAFMGIFATRADPAIIGWLAGPEEAALFSLADRISSLLLLGLVAVNAITAPLISELWATGQKQELQRVLSKAAVGIALYTLPLAVLIVAAAPFVLPLFGPGFEAAFEPLCWLVAGQSVNALAGSVGYLMMMTGNQRLAALILSVSAIIKVLMSAILIPVFGALGAALSSLGMLLIWNGALYAIVKRRLHLDPTIIGLLGSRKLT